MSDIDLNIQNYNYKELLKVFKLNADTIETRDQLQCKLNNKIQKIQSHYPPEIYHFYNKGKTIILSIYDFLKNKIIEGNHEIDTYVNKIISIPDFENKNDSELYKILVDVNINKYYDKSIIDNDEPLNTPYYNTNRLNPSLNNKNNTNAIYTTTVNEASPGDLNSVKRVTQLVNLNINSCFRNNYYQSNPCDFLYILPTEITKVISMRLVSIEIPNSWYLFSNIKKNNFFEIIIHNNDKQFCYDIIIPEGNYTCDTLQEYLNRTYFYESGLDNELKYIKFSIDPHNLRSVFEVIDNENDNNDDNNDNKQITNNISFTLKFSQNINQNIMNTFGWIVGYRLGSYKYMEKCVSEGLFDAGGDRYIYLCINDFQYNNNTSNIVCFDQSILNEDVIAKIPMINGKLSLIINDNNNTLAKIRRYNGPINLNRLQIKIIDHFGTVIDLNNMDFSLTLELEVLYENFNFKNVTA